MGYKVLVVDDEFWIRKLICSYIPENNTYNLIKEASDGFEGIEFCSQVKFDILLTDIKMPEMSGLELINKVKKLLPNIQIIVISGYEDFNFAKKALQLGVIDYLLKPIEKEAVEKVLKKAVLNLEKLKNLDCEKNKLEKKVETLQSFINMEKNTENITDLKIKSALDYIDNNYMRDLSLDEVSSHVSMNSNYFSDCFKKNIGKTFCEYLTIFRLNKAKILLKNPNLRIVDISEQSGFRDSNYFAKVFKKTLGIKPSEYRNF